MTSRRLMTNNKWLRYYCYRYCWTVVAAEWESDVPVQLQFNGQTEATTTTTIATTTMQTTTTVATDDTRMTTNSLHSTTTSALITDSRKKFLHFVRPHRTTTHVDADYCYRFNAVCQCVGLLARLQTWRAIIFSRVCLSVCLSDSVSLTGTSTLQR